MSQLKSKSIKPAPEVEIKPEDHKGLSGLKPVVPISNQGHGEYDLKAVQNSPTRTGLQPKKS